MKAFASATRPRKMYGAFPRDYQLLRDVIAAAQTVNPKVNGLTCITKTHAVLQAPGDPVYYLVEVTPEQAELLGWINL